MKQRQNSVPFETFIFYLIHCLTRFRMDPRIYSNWSRYNIRLNISKNMFDGYLRTVEEERILILDQGYLFLRIENEEGVINESISVMKIGYIQSFLPFWKKYTQANAPNYWRDAWIDYASNNNIPHDYDNYIDKWWEWATKQGGQSMADQKSDVEFSIENARAICESNLSTINENLPKLRKQLSQKQVEFKPVSQQVELLKKQISASEKTAETEENILNKQAAQTNLIRKRPQLEGILPNFKRLKNETEDLTKQVNAHESFQTFLKLFSGALLKLEEYQQVMAKSKARADNARQLHQTSRLDGEDDTYISEDELAQIMKLFAPMAKAFERDLMVCNEVFISIYTRQKLNSWLNKHTKALNKMVKKRDWFIKNSRHLMIVDQSVNNFIDHWRNKLVKEKEPRLQSWMSKILNTPVFPHKDVDVVDPRFRIFKVPISTTEASLIDPLFPERVIEARNPPGEARKLNYYVDGVFVCKTETQDAFASGNSLEFGVPDLEDEGPSGKVNVEDSVFDSIDSDGEPNDHEPEEDDGSGEAPPPNPEGPQHEVSSTTAAREYYNDKPTGDRELETSTNPILRAPHIKPAKKRQSWVMVIAITTLIGVGVYFGWPFIQGFINNGGPSNGSDLAGGSNGALVESTDVETQDTTKVEDNPSPATDTIAEGTKLVTVEEWNALLTKLEVRPSDTVVIREVVYETTHLVTHDTVVVESKQVLYDTTFFVTSETIRVETPVLADLSPEATSADTQVIVMKEVVYETTHFVTHDTVRVEVPVATTVNLAPLYAELAALKEQLTALSNKVPAVPTVEHSPPPDTADIVVELPDQEEELPWNKAVPKGTILIDGEYLQDSVGSCRVKYAELNSDGLLTIYVEASDERDIPFLAQIHYIKCDSLDENQISLAEVGYHNNYYGDASLIVVIEGKNANCVWDRILDVRIATISR